MLNVKRTTLTRYVTTKGLEILASRLGWCDEHVFPTACPKNHFPRTASKNDPAVQFPAVWRDCLTANIEVASVPELKTLHRL
ncbi:unnamed protein product [Leptosia nina]|uniref:Uncharacterized protein n=1 Tax=Leptosia nina TaxID=320188 RepID=A0AAV1JY47_9NEOP